MSAIDDYEKLRDIKTRIENWLDESNRTGDEYHTREELLVILARQFPNVDHATLAAIVKERWSVQQND